MDVEGGVADDEFEGDGGSEVAGVKESSALYTYSRVHTYISAAMLLQFCA